ADEAVAQAGLLDWPVVVKPRRSRASGPAGALEAFTVSYAADADQLAAQVATLEGRVPALLQEHCPGEGVGVEVLMLDGRPLAAFQHRRLREVPPSGGASALRESVALDPVLLGHTVRLLGALGWTGLAMAEFKVGRAGARLMEVNGRIWGSLALAVRSGMDFPARLADVLTGNGDRVATSFDGDYAVGVRSRDLELELRWIGTVLRGVPPLAATASPSRRDALRVAAALVHPADGYDVLSAADPWPGAAEAATLVARGIRALRRRHVGAGR
ncbi:MAG: ATP-grasp domain-containing protein, partial [Actinomycetota bacterium]|nr:ATP-grasp domain-containing protein [Actinomycetota bacterium]